LGTQKRKSKRVQKQTSQEVNMDISQVAKEEEKIKSI
jgi:hypothetical protein